MQPQELLIGAVDMHLHSGPALTPRGFDHVEVIRSSIKAGMRAIVIKDQQSQAEISVSCYSATSFCKENILMSTAGWF